MRREKRSAMPVSSGGGIAAMAWPSMVIVASATRRFVVISRSPSTWTMSPIFTVDAPFAPCTRQCEPAASSIKKNDRSSRWNVTTPVRLVVAACAAIATSTAVTTIAALFLLFIVLFLLLDFHLAQIRLFERAAGGDGDDAEGNEARQKRRVHGLHRKSLSKLGDKRLLTWQGRAW